MSTQQRINSDIYQSISQPEVTQFTVVDVRDYILENSDMYGNKNTARLFSARQLQKLEDIGLIESVGRGRHKVYSKSDDFFRANFKFVDKKRKTSIPKTAEVQRNRPIAIELESEKNHIEAELAITLAEVDEYKVLMARSGELNELLRPSYSVTAQKAAALMAKLNVWTSAIELIRHNRSATC